MQANYLYTGYQKKSPTPVLTEAGRFSFFYQTYFTIIVSMKEVLLRFTLSI